MYAANIGSSACKKCGANTHATVGCPAHSSDWPLNCPIGIGNKVDAGGTACTAIVVSALAVPGTLTQIISGNGPIFGLFGVGCVFSVFAALLLHLRKQDSHVVQIPVLAFLFGFISTGIALATEVLLVIVLFANTDVTLYTSCGVLVILFRVAHMAPAFYFQYTLSGHTRHSAHYLMLLDDAHYLQHMAPYSIISILALFETSLYRFLPWKHSEFAFAAGGYPDLFINRLCTYTKAVQATITVLVQFIFVLTVNSHVVNVSVSTHTVFVLGLGATMLALFLSIHEAVTKVNLLRQIMQNIERQEAQKADASISDAELAALPSAQLAQMVRSEREAAAAKEETLKAELTRAQQLMASFKSTSSSFSMSRYFCVGKEGSGEGSGGGEASASAGTATSRAAAGLFAQEQVDNPITQHAAFVAVVEGATTVVADFIPAPLQQPSSRLSLSAAAARGPIGLFDAAADTSSTVNRWGGGEAAHEARRASIVSDVELTQSSPSPSPQQQHQ